MCNIRNPYAVKSEMCIRGGVDLRANQPSQITFMQNFVAEVQKDFAPQESFVTCPVGILFLLSTLFGTGATRGRTGYQIARTLQLRTPFTERDLTGAQTEVKVFYEDMHDELATQETYIQDRRVNVMTTSNGLFTKAGYELQPYFLRRAKTEYQATVQQLDFNNQSESARHINNWVNQETRGLVPRIFSSPNELPPDTRVALFNVFTFKDTWQRVFMSHATMDEEFHVSAGRTIKVPTMNMVEILPYANLPNMGVAMIKKPLQNSRYSFIVILPTEKFNTDALTPILAGQVTIKDLFTNLESHTISLKLPKFNLKATKDLIRTLRAMGVEDLFNRGMADLSGITTSERLYVNMLKQSVVLKVDEAGVEAAAVTSAIAVPTSLLIPDANFHVNHPFLCMIYDESLHVPLIVARVMEPRN